MEWGVFNKKPCTDWAYKDVEKKKSHFARAGNTVSLKKNILWQIRIITRAIEMHELWIPNSLTKELYGWVFYLTLPKKLLN